MGERIATTLTLGGKVKRADAEELIELLGQYDFWVNDGANYGVPLTVDLLLLDQLRADEVNYGQIDDVIAFCHENDIAYEHWVEDCQGAPPLMYRWVPGMDAPKLTSCVEGEPAIPISRILEVENLVDGFAKLIAEAKAWTKSLPPLEIV